MLAATLQMYTGIIMDNPLMVNHVHINHWALFIPHELLFSTSCCPTVLELCVLAATSMPIIRRRPSCVGWRQKLSGVPSWAILTLYFVGLAHLSHRV
jgi:hypothetical protein